MYVVDGVAEDEEADSGNDGSCDGRRTGRRAVDIAAAVARRLLWLGDLTVDPECAAIRACEGSVAR